MSNSTSTDLSPLALTGIQTLEFTRSFTNALLDAMDDSKWFKAPCSGGNHAAWIVGHIALTDQYFFTSLGGLKPIVPEDWNAQFGMKTESIEDASAYPSPKELRDALNATRARSIEWFGSLSDTELLETVEGNIAQFCKSRAHLMGSLSFHEGMHAGQLSVARRAQGMPPLF